MSDDPTIPGMPLPVELVHRNATTPYRHERWLFLALAVAYLMAGAVLGLAMFLLADVADQIRTAPLCRRI